jgi:general stress protein 26
MTVIHLVQFKFKDEVTVEEVHQVATSRKVNLILTGTGMQPYASVEGRVSASDHEAAVHDVDGGRERQQSRRTAGMIGDKVAFPTF